MNKLSLTILLIAVCLLSLTTAKFNAHGIKLDQVAIYGVSTSIKSMNQYAKGSIAGGTTIYITCSGHDMISTQNKVNIGPYECIIPEKGVTATTISCVTTEAHDITRRENLAVELQVVGKQQSVCKGNCNFSYKFDVTPLLQYITPTASAPYRDIKWKGNYRVGNTIDIRKMIIGNEKNGEFNCNRFQLRDVAPGEHLNLNDDEDVNSEGYVPCTVASEQIAGFYNVDAEIRWGSPVKKSTLNQYTRDGQTKYQFAVTPEITQVSQHSAGSAGTLLRVEGRGFGFNKDEVKVNIGEDLECTIESISNEEILCRVEDGQTQAVDEELPGQFIKGQGAIATYYDCYRISDAKQLFQKVQEGTAPLRENMPSEQISIWDVSQLSKYTGASIVGYFYAPRTGNYNFWGAADDFLAVYLNQTPLTQSVTSNDLILEKCQQSLYRRFFSPPAKCQYRSENIHLEEGNYYWIEAYVRNYKGTGHMSLSVETPEIENFQPKNSVPTVLKYAITPEVDTQIWSFKVWGDDTPFGVKFQYKNQQSNKVEWDKQTKQKRWDQWTAQFFKEQIAHATGGFSPRVTEYSLDGSGNRCDGNDCDAKGKEFEVEFLDYRQPAGNNATPKFTGKINKNKSSITKTQEQYRGIASGHYTMKFNNEFVEVKIDNEWTTNIPYDADSSTIKQGLIRLTGNNNITVEQKGDFDTGIERYISLISEEGEFTSQQKLKFENFMEGNKPGTRPQITKETISQASDRLFFSPIPFDFIFQAANVPSVIVEVQGIPSTVNIGVDNSFQSADENTPIISSYSISGNTLNLALTQGNIAFENSQVQISYGFSECENYNGTSCTFASSLVEGGGDHQPIVYVNGVGYAVIDSSFNAPSNPVPVSVSSVSPSSGSIYGGIEVVISGTGFSSQTDRASVKFGNAEAEILSISTTQINVKLPAAQGNTSSPQTITVEINGAQNTDKTFTFSDQGVPTISQISPEKASPVQKGTITITGTNFGTNENDIKVQLFNEQQGEIAYDLFLQTVTDTQIEATLSGGRVGDYQLKVYKNGKGYSTDALAFSYKIEIHDVQPTKGSLLGGTLLTITGQNFSTTVTDNLVFITNETEEINEICQIQTATATEITCVTPPKSEHFEDNEELLVYVQGRLIEESTPGAFTYSSSVTPSLDEQEEAFTVGGDDTIITVKGSGFVQGNNATLQFTPEISVEGTVTSSTKITFNTPSIVAGSYGALVSIDGLGYAGIFQVIFELSVENIEPSIISTPGAIMNITGKGFDTNAYVTIADLECKIISQSITNIQCIAPKRGKNSYDLKIQQGGEDSILYTHPNKIQYKFSLKTQFSDPSQTQFQAGNIVIDLTNTEKLDVDGVVITPLLLKQKDLSTKYTGSYANQQISFNNNDVPAGSYLIYIQREDRGLIQIENLQKNEIQVVQYLSVPQTTTGLFGGNLLEISGDGFDINNLQNNDVKVCGYQCQVQDSTTFEQLDCLLPTVNTKYLQDKNQKYPQDNFVLVQQGKQQQQVINGIPVQMIADNVNSNNFKVLSEEGRLKQYQATLESNSCFVGYNFGDYLRVKLDSIIITTDVTDLQQSKQLYGAKLQVSNDQQNWTDILEFDESNLKAYTYIHEFDIEEVPLTQYVRFYNESDENDSAYCGITGFNVSGFNYYRQEIENDSDFTCDVTVNVNGQEQILPQKVTYSSASSSTVENISPYYGWQLGGTEVTITGENFGNNTNAVSVYFDDIQCIVSSVSNTEIVCTTGDKGADNYAASKVSVSVNGINAIIPDGLFFYYGLLWSEDASWGLEAAPRAGDSVFVAQGRTLIIDQSSPKYIDTVINQGRIIFADTGRDMEFHVKYFINQKSELIIGTEFNTYQSNLTITLYGSKNDKQLPQFGVKVIACQKCTLDIHGQEKSPNWTFIETTVNPGTSTLTTKVLTNWQVGDRLVLATTDFDGKHSEEIFITSINGDSIEFQPELKYTHISVTEDYGNKELNMWAEIGNLSRNIVIQGNPEDNDLELYGGHIMMHGEGAIARIENTEFTKTGQSMIIGRYTMHFHMVGDSRRSYIRGNAVHHAYARVVALHDIRNLRVENNVSYWVRAHNIFLENGIETDNQIHRNLIVSPRTAFNMLQTDITVAGIWITNPTNYVTYNHVVGSQFYGLWYEIFERPETPNTANDICPEGEKLGATDHNVAHSNERFGLRIFKFAARKYSCLQVKDLDTRDLWSSNPSYESVFTNHTLYKNGQSGLLAEEVGNSKFQDFILADNYFAGFQAHKTNITKEEVVLENSLIVGQSLYTQSLDQKELEYLRKADQSAIVTPRTNGFRVKNVEVYNQQEGSNIIFFASENDHIKKNTSGGKQINIENISVIDSENAQVVKWIGHRFNIIYDQDGSLTGTGQPTYISPYYTHLDQPISEGKCQYNQDTISKYDGSVICTGTKLRSIPVGNLQKDTEFQHQIFKVINLNDQEKAARFNTTEESEEDFTAYKKPKILSGDSETDYVLIYATDYAYNLHWNQNLDWSHLQIQPSYSAEDDDKTVILRFNYTEQRELFDIFKREGSDLTKQYEQVFDYSKFYNEDGKPNSSDDSCSLGQYYIDQDIQTVSICVNNKGRTNKYQAVDVNGVYCRHTCTKVELTCEKEESQKSFSNQQIWQDQNGNLPLRKRPTEQEYSHGVPQRGDDVLIPCPWTLNFDIAEFEFGTLIIDGTLIIPDEIPRVTITANNIWVRSGKIVAGTEQYPYQNKLDIVLTGNRFSPALVIDDISRTGTKSLAVTGRLELYGKIPQITQTRLFDQAQIGANQITVEAETNSWSVGDELILGGSAIDGSGFEKVKISAIQGKTITLEQPLKFYHYGAKKATIGNDLDSAFVQIDERFGAGLDMRTVVGNISRNIRIQGTEEDELGGHLQVYHWVLQEESETEIIDIDQRGSILLSGVELNNMGQIDSDNAAIHILNTKYGDNDDNEQGEEKLQSKVIGSSIHDCFGICVNLVHTRNVKLENNVIFNGVKFLISNYGYRQSVIVNNLLVGAVDSPYGSYTEPDCFIYMFQRYNPATSGTLVEGNIGQSAKGAAFIFPPTPCEQKDQIAFKNNQAGNINGVGIIYNYSSNGCQTGGHNHIYHAVEGVTVHTKKTTEIGWDLERQILVENDTGLIMRSGSDNDYLHHNNLRDTYISGLILGESCPECYNSQSNGKYFKCSNQLGALMLLTNLQGNAPPLAHIPAMGIKALCNAPVISSQVYINDCEFANFRNDYSTDPLFSNLEEGVCKGNTVFIPNRSASEATAAHFLKNTKCTNCDRNGKFKLLEPKSSERGWFGGCGIMDCTGQENVMAQDLTGDFLGIVGTAISNNEAVGYGFINQEEEQEQTNNNEMKDTCEFIPAWNGFLCERDDIAQLQWESIGPDAQIIDTAPVIVRNDQFENKINMWKEWVWIGPEPQNRRRNSYVSLALVNQRHTITYSGSQSMDIIHKLSHRNTVGEQNRYVILESQYNNPLTIEVLVNGQIIPPFSFKNQEDLGQYTTDCGRNNYYYNNSTIHFVVTNVPTCQVQVRQVNNVQINARISLTEEEFYGDDNAETTFINRIAAFLSIPFDRVRIVGIVSKNNNNRLRNLEEEKEKEEVQLQVVIIGGSPGTEETNYDASEDYQDLQQLGQKLTEGVNNDEVEQMLGAEYKVNVVKKAGTAETDEDYFGEQNLIEKEKEEKEKERENIAQKTEEKDEGGNTIALALGVIFGLLAIILVVLIGYHFYSKRALKKIQQLQVQSIDDINKPQVKQAIPNPQLNQ